MQEKGTGPRGLVSASKDADPHHPGTQDTAQAGGDPQMAAGTAKHVGPV